MLWLSIIYKHYPAYGFPSVPLGARTFGQSFVGVTSCFQPWSTQPPNDFCQRMGSRSPPRIVQESNESLEIKVACAKTARRLTVCCSLELWPRTIPIAISFPQYSSTTYILKLHLQEKYIIPWRNIQHITQCWRERERDPWSLLTGGIEEG